MRTDLLIGLVVASCGFIAVAAGGVVVRWVFRQVDRDDALARAKAHIPGMAGSDPSAPEPSLTDETADRLRGGEWIGRLERIAVFAAVLAGATEAIAVVLAIKGLARYPELKVRSSNAAEGFIIGTFTSVLWAAAWAGLSWYVWHRLLP